MSDSRILSLSLPAQASRTERIAFKRLCAILAARDPSSPSLSDRSDLFLKVAPQGVYSFPILAAAANVAIDLADQGWTIKVDKLGPLFTPPLPGQDLAAEKERIRSQELVSRDTQLRKPSVRKFVNRMEGARLHAGKLVSVFDLMRDGEELAFALLSNDLDRPAIAPYVQIVDSTRCEHTGLKLQDIWRYFRHTWSNAYSTVPGRSMALLVRDASTEFHPVIGIAAVSSPVVQIAERDQWIGWDADGFLADVTARPRVEVAEWFAHRMKSQLGEIHADDLLRDKVLEPSDLLNPSPSAVALLRVDSERFRKRHHRASHLQEVRAMAVDGWLQRAESDLFRSKRSAALAEAFEITLALRGYLSPVPSVEGLQQALSDPAALKQLRRIVRRARGERVGTVIADLTVCGAVAPYNELAAGKLVGALAVSPKVLDAYRRRYSRPSEIASSIAGRPVEREARLAYIGTTSLYGTGSSQYNRLFWPSTLVGGDGQRIGFHPIGRSRSFGTSHFSIETVEALVRVSAVLGNGVRVNSLFGEGVSPRMRKVRLGLTSLGWPANELMKHGRERLIYGVPLVSNLRDYALGIEAEPDLLFDPESKDSEEQVGRWWLDRWGLPRSRRPEVMERVQRHVLSRPVLHGARVTLPALEDDSGTFSLFDEVQVQSTWSDAVR